MQTDHKMHLKQVGKIALTFVLVYPFILFAWLEVQVFYNTFIVQSIMSLVDLYFPFTVTLVEHTEKHFDFLIVDTLTMQGQELSYKAKMELDTSNITFNVPMTLSAVLALIIQLRRSVADFWILLQVVVILMGLHFITIGFLPLYDLYQAMQVNDMMKEYLKDYATPLHDYTYIQNFLIAYGVRFEPFLMMVFTWFRLQASKE